ncbi:hypothetical protein ICM49_05095 [Leucobacter sp. cx-169]|nr:hypothetical protein [Leucobacter sp. cx-169]
MPMATSSFTLADPSTREDLKIFLERLQRSARPEVRLLARGGVLAVYGCTQAPAGLLDSTPVVLVMRGFALAEPTDGETSEPFDALVEGRAILDRIARLSFAGRTIELPPNQVTAAWAGVLPPVSGWEPVASIDGPSLAAVAKDGIERVAQALPQDPGEALVTKVRASVWGAEIAPGIPAAAAFALEAAGFLSGESVARQYTSSTWSRLSTDRGHALVRGR